MSKTDEFEFVSFFSGALGLDLGLEQAGLSCLAANEINPIACQTIRANRPEVRLYEKDIRDIEPEELLTDIGKKVGELFLVTGGPPCQAFSTAGRRLGLNDDRGNVFISFIDMVGALQPRYVVIENVRGLLSAPLIHRPHNERGAGFEPLTDEENPGGALRHIVSRLSGHGYKVSFNLYSSAMFGVPQVRERVILFGTLLDGEVPDLVPTHSQNGEHGLNPWATVQDAFEKLDGDSDFVSFSEKRIKFLKMLQPGQYWRHLPKEVQKEAMGKSFYSGGGKTGFYRRLAWDKPSPTLVTSPAMPATYLSHPVEDRPLSVQEYARIQTFPDHWKFCGNISDRYRQIGNAVPVKFGKVVGEHLLKHHNGELDPQYRASVPLSRYRHTSSREWYRSIEEEESKRQSQLALL